MSLSARRAWIEITLSREELAKVIKSLSARRAWIEMPCWVAQSVLFAVALRKESVDRNVY